MILRKDKEFQRYKGRIVQLKTYEKIDGEKEFEGELVGLIDGKIVIMRDNQEIKFDKTQVSIIKLKVIF